MARRASYAHLDSTPVTDAGLECLEALSNLAYLQLTNTQVTGAGVAKFEQALPRVLVVQDVSVPSTIRR